MKIQEITTMYEYNTWANRLILTTCAQVSPDQFIVPTSHSFGSLRGTLVHTLDAEYSWRVLCQTGQLTFDTMKETDFSTLDALEQRWRDEDQAWQTYLGGLRDEDLDSIVRYTIPEGIVRERVLWHCLFHVVNHGMQHRSECAAMLTDCGQSPGNLDFTRFLNERQ
jgi:uncharacterized damage-inducible protein DinB